MEGSFFDELRQFEFFGGDEKPTQFGTASQTPVVSSTAPYSGEYISQGIYQNEESIDLTSILEACNSTTSVSSPDSVFSQQVSPHYTSNPDLVSSVNHLEPVFSFSNYCPPATVPVSSQGMYGNENCHPVMHPSEMASNPVSSVEPLSVQTTVSTTVPIGQTDPLAGTRPSPGKMTRKTKKQAPVKNTEEWRQKRDRNNVAVRKSREKSKRRIQETENRVKELEEENRQLQSKITLLSKELNVLKSLFTSAGVAQPPLCVKEELVHHMP